MQVFFSVLGPVQLLGWEFQNQTVRTILLFIGLAAAISGVMLMLGHQREMQTTENDQVNKRKFKHAQRKFRRRMTGSLLIALVGLLLAALYWVTQPRVFAAIVVIMLSLLLALMVLAFFDMFNIGLQVLTDPQDEKRKELVQEVLRRREQSDSDSTD